MKTFKKDSNLFKVLHVSALYAIVLQSFFPMGNLFAAPASDLPDRPVTTGFVLTSAPVKEQLTPAELPKVSTAALSAKPKTPETGQAAVVLGGPGQTESGGFSLNSMDGMVDQFTGDFSYSIPLMDVEGYPLVLSYNSNVGMMDEASWVGLGWNLNVGSVAREMRGIPDDFNGTQEISRVYKTLEDEVWDGFKYGVTLGFMRKGLVMSRKSKIGTDLTLLFGAYTNTYTGRSRTFDFNIGASLSTPVSVWHDQAFFGLKGGLGYSSDSKNGIGRSSSVGLIGSFGENDNATEFGNFGLSYGSNYHSRMGLTQRSINGNASFSGGAKIKNYAFGAASLPASLGSTFTCGSITSVPQMQMSSRSESKQFIQDFSYSISANPTAKWKYTVGIETQNYTSNQDFEYSNPDTYTIVNPAFGYFHSNARKFYNGWHKPVMDFNRERDAEFSEDMTNLPFSVPTYDVFYVNGMGMSATFRGQRNDLGTYYDATLKNDSEGDMNNVSVGLASVGPKLSVTIGYTNGGDVGEAKSGKWSYSGQEYFRFGSDDEVYFKAIGEPTAKTWKLITEVGGTKPAYQKLEGVDGSLVAIQKTDQLIHTGGPTTLNASTLATSMGAKEVRANVYKPVLADELGTTDSRHKLYPENVFVTPTTSNFTRIDGSVHYGHHVSAVEVLATNGMHYSYALPVYSVNQSDITFSTDGTAGDAQGLINCGGENVVGNTSGRMHLYDRTTVPSYATAFLLTGVTSGDYVDLGNDGYTLDDIGDYYKINYTRVYDQSDPYKWRFPMGGDKAFFHEGLLATELDNTATYTYGEKEIWYTHSLESKNLVAEFTLEDRDDAVSVTEAGVFESSKPLKLLKKITLYNRSERLSKGASAKPMQIVEFIYDYHLCKNNPANVNTVSNPGGDNTGKLTLLEIRVYSGPQSEETALQPYRFTYDTGNPDFHYKNTDRWGNYKPDNVTKPLELFPYAEQDETTAAVNVASWKMTKIIMPSGSEMDVTYEADSYRYVQNKRAMTHDDIVGYTNQLELADLLDQSTWDGTYGVDEKLHDALSVSEITSMTGLSTGTVNALISEIAEGMVTNTIPTNGTLAPFFKLSQVPRNVVVFKLDHAISAATKEDAEVLFRERHLKTDTLAPIGQGYIDEVYLRDFVQIKKGGAFELVPTFAKIYKGDLDYSAFGYGTIKSTGLMPADAGSPGSYEYGYIVLENVLSSDDSKFAVAMSPVQKTALEFAKLNLTDVVYGSCVDCDAELNIDKKAFWTGDIYKEMAKTSYCQEISTDLPSQIRLFDDDNKKLGGNARVGRITINDKWSTISDEANNAVYYWDYEYDRTSYGVAAYEPMSGNDENPYYRWDRYTNKSVSFPDQSRYTVAPIGEMLYPSPVVGYKTVTVSISGASVGAYNGLGISKATFMTAREHPTISSSTELQKVDAKKKTPLGVDISLFGFSQGHSIITNDFHGKPYDYRVYSAQGDLQARTTYYYKGFAEPVKMLEKDGDMSSEIVATEYDLYADSRLVTSRNGSYQLGLTLSFPLFPVPSPIPDGIYPVIGGSEREVGFYAQTFNKHINYSAIVDRVETETLGSVNTAKDLVYDRESGVALLTSLTDEYNEPLYSFSYPAHWYYTLFRNPLEQPTASISGTLSSGLFTASSSLVDKLTVGDVVNLTGTSTVSAYVLKVSGSTAQLIKTTAPFTSTAITNGSYTLTLAKSGRKNTLAIMMQNVVTKRNPVTGPTAFTFPTADIIDASAITFRPRLNLRCHVSDEQAPPISVPVGAVINPFSRGVLNNLIKEHAYVPQLERSSAEVQGIRYNGTYTGYYPFYAQKVNDEWARVDETGHPNLDATDLRNWRPMGEITELDEYGKSLESVDQIKVPSAVLYGYNRMNKLMPVAQAVNAQQREIAYDSFDDYSYHAAEIPAYLEGHFDFAQAIADDPTNVSLSSTVRHSGVRSLSVNMGVTASVRRDASGIDCRSVDSFTEDEFEVEECMCIKDFKPTSGSEYVISLWVKGSAVDSTNSYTDCSVTITYDGSGTTETLNPAGQMLDGWQRMEKTFTVPVGASGIYVNLNNLSAISNTKVYFDDIRIHPVLAGMTTTVYDPETLLPMATHDGYNFTTFYGYDENLMPVRTRVETINGIQTISESEGSTIKDDKQ